MIVEAIEGGAIVVGTFGGYIRGRIRGRTKPAKQPKPICGCTHHLSLHDPVTGECHETYSEADQWITIKYKDAYETSEKLKPSHFVQVRCACRQYVGPKPVDSFFTSEVNWDTAVMKKEN